jgi:hypothetical protein
MGREVCEESEPAILSLELAEREDAIWEGQKKKSAMSVKVLAKRDLSPMDDTDRVSCGNLVSGVVERGGNCT